MARTYGIIPWIEIVNGCLASATVVLARFGADAGIAASAWLGIAAYVGYRLAFGTDPTVEDLYSSIKGFDAAEAARTMEAGHTALERCRRALSDIHGSSQADALESVIGMGERIVSQIENDPKRLPTAQRFLDIYLDGVANAAEKYAHLRGRGESEAIKLQFQDLLTDAKAVCERQERALIESDENDLDVDITVLRRRMQLERQPAKSTIGFSRETR